MNKQFTDCNRKCITCGSVSWRKLYSVTDTNGNILGKWDIIQCNTCGLGMLYPFPTPSDVDAFYKNIFYDDSGKRFNFFIETIRSFLAKLRGRHLDGLTCKARPRLLDYGSGAKHFVNAQRKRGWDAHSFDPYCVITDAKKYTEINEERSIDSIRHNEDGSYDVITLWYVIEHLYDPETTIRELDALLPQGGFLLCSQQNFASSQARFFKGSWLMLDPPRHLWQFSRSNLDLLMKKFNYIPVRTSNFSFELGPFTILQSIQNLLIGNKNYLFRALKSKSVRNITTRDIPGIISSILLLPILLPISLILAGILSIFGSGDIFTVVYRKYPDCTSK